MIASEEIGFVGNVWVRQNYMQKAGDVVGGHMHHHDHVSLLTNGSVEITIDDNPPKRFSSPTFIVIKKEHRHRIVALEDNTVFYCVFAVRDVDGNLTDIYEDAHLPFFYGAVESDATP